MNIAGMMQQAQKMQKRLQDAQAELKNETIEKSVQNGAVTITCDGQGKIKSIKIAPTAISPENPDSVDKDTLEMLEDLIMEAIKSATDEASAKMEAKMKSITGGISIPGLF